MSSISHSDCCIRSCSGHTRTECTLRNNHNNHNNHLCRRGGIRWWRCCRRSTRHLSSRLSPCPRSLWTESHSDLPFVVRRRRNNWWKCPRSCPSLLYSSRLPSRSSTFQFQVVEVFVENKVFKVSPLDRIQRHGLWSRTLTFQFLEGLHDLPHPGASSSSSVSRDERGQGFFLHCSPEEKKREVRRNSESDRARHGRLVRGCRSRTSTSSTMVPCASGLGTRSTSVIVGASLTSGMVTALSQYGSPHGSSSHRGHSDLSRPGTWSWPCGPCSRWRASS